MPRPLVYLDTSAINSLHAALSRGIVPPSAVDRHQFVVSSCQLDEIALSEPEKAADLASVLWSHSNRRKLRDHVELTELEVRAALRGRGPAFHEYYDDGDTGFKRAWRAMRERRASPEQRTALRAQVEQAKSAFKVAGKLERELFKSLRESVQGYDFKSGWKAMLRDLRRDGRIGELVWSTLSRDPFSNVAADFRESEVIAVDYLRLPTTAVGLEYYLARRYVADFGSGEIARPSRGDQVDFRHSYYAGLVDIFVSGDDIMLTLLREFVKADTAEILSAQDFIASLR